MAVQVIELREYETSHFRREEIVRPDGTSRILPEVRQHAAIDLRDTITGITLHARGLAGYLPLTDSLALHISPRFPMRNLWDMLLLTDEQYDHLVQVLRHYAHGPAGPPHLMLVRSFCYFIRLLLASGIWRAYRQEYLEGYFKPKIHFGRTVSRFLSRGDIINVARVEFVLSNRQAANATLKVACEQFLRLTPRLPGWDRERADLHDALNLLQRVPGAELLPNERDLTYGIPSWLHRGYEGALSVYSIFRGYIGIGFQHDPAGSELPSFLFKLDEIFEQFVRTSLRKSMADTQIKVFDGNRLRTPISLFRDSDRYQVMPDAILRRGGRAIAIVEMKYKPKISEGDRYQVISHTLAAGASLGILVSPEIQDAGGLDYIGSLSDRRFYHYRLNISGDLTASRNQMATDILKLVGW